MDRAYCPVHPSHLASIEAILRRGGCQRYLELELDQGQVRKEHWKLERQQLQRVEEPQEPRRVAHPPQGIAQLAKQLRFRITPLAPRKSIRPDQDKHRESQLGELCVIYFLYLSLGFYDSWG